MSHTHHDDPNNFHHTHQVPSGDTRPATEEEQTYIQQAFDDAVTLLLSRLETLPKDIDLAFLVHFSVEAPNPDPHDVCLGCGKVHPATAVGTFCYGFTQQFLRGSKAAANHDEPFFVELIRAIGSEVQRHLMQHAAGPSSPLEQLKQMLDSINTDLQKKRKKGKTGPETIN